MVEMRCCLYGWVGGWVGGWRDVPLEISMAAASTLRGRRVKPSVGGWVGGWVGKE